MRAASRANFSHSQSVVGSFSCFRLAFNKSGVASALIGISFSRGTGQQAIELGEVGWPHGHRRQVE